LGIEDKVKNHIECLKKEISILEYRKNELIKEQEKRGLALSQVYSKIEVLKMSSEVLQQLIEKVSKRNILKIEELVNRALANIFYDMKITVKIQSESKRNNTQYSIKIIQENRKGGVNSYGGGVVCIVSLILKFMFNILNKSFPIIAFDETLSFLYEGYIPYASQFIREISKEFSLPVFMSTHQVMFCENADNRYYICGKGDKSVIERLM
jgi:hypothetical protein